MIWPLMQKAHSSIQVMKGLKPYRIVCFKRTHISSPPSPTLLLLKRVLLDYEIQMNLAAPGSEQRRGWLWEGLLFEVSNHTGHDQDTLYILGFFVLFLITLEPLPGNKPCNFGQVCVPKLEPQRETEKCSPAIRCLWATGTSQPDGFALRQVQKQFVTVVEFQLA